MEEIYFSCFYCDKVDPTRKEEHVHLNTLSFEENFEILRKLVEEQDRERLSESAIGVNRSISIEPELIVQENIPSDENVPRLESERGSHPVSDVENRATLFESGFLLQENRPSGDIIPQLESENPLTQFNSAMELVSQTVADIAVTRSISLSSDILLQDNRLLGEIVPQLEPGNQLTTFGTVKETGSLPVSDVEVNRATTFGREILHQENRPSEESIPQLESANLSTPFTSVLPVVSDMQLTDENKQGQQPKKGRSKKSKVKINLTRDDHNKPLFYTPRRRWNLSYLWRKLDEPKKLWIYTDFRPTISITKKDELDESFLNEIATEVQKIMHSTTSSSTPVPLEVVEPIMNSAVQQSHLSQEGDKEISRESLQGVVEPVISPTVQQSHFLQEGVEEIEQIIPAQESLQEVVEAVMAPVQQFDFDFEEEITRMTLALEQDNNILLGLPFKKMRFNPPEETVPPFIEHELPLAETANISTFRTSFSRTRVTATCLMAQVRTLWEQKETKITFNDICLSPSSTKLEAATKFSLLLDLGSQGLVNMSQDGEKPHQIFINKPLNDLSNAQL